MVCVNFHNMIQRERKKKLISPLNSNNSFFFTNFSIIQNKSKYVYNMSAIKVDKCSAFLFVQSMHCLFFGKVLFFLLLFLCCIQQCSSYFSSFLFFFLLCLFPFTCRPLSFLINKLLIPYFFNLISASLCLYFNIITTGSCTPLNSISNKYFHK